jgi:hypothetical protein
VTDDMQRIVDEQIEVLRLALLGIGDTYADESRCPQEPCDALPFLVFLTLDALKTAVRDFEDLRAQRDVGANFGR